MRVDAAASALLAASLLPGGDRFGPSQSTPARALRTTAGSGPQGSRRRAALPFSMAGAFVLERAVWSRLAWADLPQHLAIVVPGRHHGHGGQRRASCASPGPPRVCAADHPLPWV